MGLGGWDGPGLRRAQALPLDTPLAAWAGPDLGPAPSASSSVCRRRLDDVGAWVPLSGRERGEQRFTAHANNTCLREACGASPRRLPGALSPSRPGESGTRWSLCGRGNRSEPSWRSSAWSRQVGAVENPRERGWGTGGPPERGSEPSTLAASLPCLTASPGPASINASCTSDGLAHAGSGPAAESSLVAPYLPLFPR